jgi:hypothetical protein
LEALDIHTGPQHNVVPHLLLQDVLLRSSRTTPSRLHGRLRQEAETDLHPKQSPAPAASSGQTDHCKCAKQACLASNLQRHKQNPQEQARRSSREEAQPRQPLRRPSAWGQRLQEAQRLGGGVYRRPRKWLRQPSSPPEALQRQAARAEAQRQGFSTGGPCGSKRPELRPSARSSPTKGPAVASGHGS